MQKRLVQIGSGKGHLVRNASDPEVMLLGFLFVDEITEEIKEWFTNNHSSIVDAGYPGDNFFSLRRPELSVGNVITSDYLKSSLRNAATPPEYGYGDPSWIKQAALGQMGFRTSQHCAGFNKDVFLLFLNSTGVFITKKNNSEDPLRLSFENSSAEMALCFFNHYAKQLMQNPGHDGANVKSVPTENEQMFSKYILAAINAVKQRADADPEKSKILDFLEKQTTRVAVNCQNGTEVLWVQVAACVNPSLTLTKELNFNPTENSSSSASNKATAYEHK